MMKKLVLFTALCLMSVGAFAIPARRDGRVVTRPDGTTMTVYAHGDETFHWLTNEAGEWVECTDNGDYQVVPALTQEQIAARMAASPRRIAQKTSDASPLNIAQRGLIILVNFQDKKFQTSTAEMDSMLNGQNYTRNYSYSYRIGTQKYTVNVQSEGSAREYFYNASFKNYHPTFDVVGPVTVSQKMSYYGGNDSNGNDKNPYAMIKEACQQADSLYDINFADYDNDGDGEVDYVYVYYAGYGEADGGSKNTIWPHSYDLSYVGKAFKLDGVKIDRYGCGNEMAYLSDQHDGIGTFCHEFSHILGLPDLYITTSVSTTYKTLGAWDIMDYGPYNNDGNTPPNYSGYERFFMGWATPRVLAEAENVTLKDLGSSNEVLLISSTNEHNLIGNNPSPTTFYILENRQQEGLDEYIPGHGLMLTQIKYSYYRWYNNKVNNARNSMGVDLIEADGDAPEYDSSDYENGYDGKTTDLFPAGATSYTGISGHEITGITEKDGVIYFNYQVATGVADISITGSEKVLAIYNILGQQMETTNISSLERGTYIVRTSSSSKKIVIP